MSVGTQSHAAVMQSIELFGTKVAPVVRAELASRVSPVPRFSPGYFNGRCSLKASSRYEPNPPFGDAVARTNASIDCSSCVLT